MAYLNCPACHLSIEQRHGRPALAECPRCHALGRLVPLFKSRLRWPELAAPGDQVSGPHLAGTGEEG